MCLSISLKYSVSSVVGFLKGKSAIEIARQFRGFWARGYFVSTEGLDEATIGSTYERRSWGYYQQTKLSSGGIHA